MLAWFKSTFRAFQGDSKARYAAWSRAVLAQPCVVRRPVMLNVVLVNVVLPSAAARVISAWSVYASTRRSINALAQHALAADAATRRARSCVFQRPYLLQCDCHQSVPAPLKRKPLGALRHNYTENV